MSTIFSQPANTGAGTHRATQLAIALDALRSERNPVSLHDFAIRHNLEVLLTDGPLWEGFANNERVVHNLKNDTWSWKPDFDLRTPADLLNIVKKRYKESVPPQPMGFRLTDLRESYPQVRDVIDAHSKRGPTKREAEMEEDREVGKDDDSKEEEKKKLLILPHSKEGSIRQVYWNEASGKEFIEANGERRLESIDQEFRDLWHSLPVPESVDMYKDLAQQGLSAAQASQSTGPNAGAANLRARGRGRGRGRGMGRKVRIQNTHLDGIDLSSNYQG